MINYIKRKLVYLPRPFRIWWGRCFLFMLGKNGTQEFKDDIDLFYELKNWVNKNGKPKTS
jgi:hypothetical protein